MTEPIHEFGIRCHYMNARANYVDCPCVVYVGERQRPRCSKFNVALRTSQCRGGTIYRAEKCRDLDPGPRKTHPIHPWALQVLRQIADKPLYCPYVPHPIRTCFRRNGLAEKVKALYAFEGLGGESKLVLCYVLTAAGRAVLDKNPQPPEGHKKP